MKFGFYSCMTGIRWGGSEELWWRAARRLQSQSHEICVNYKWWPNRAKQLNELAEQGADIFHREQPLRYWAARWNQLNSLWKKNRCFHEKWLSESKPDAVLITLGYHPDRVDIADVCHRMGIPYAINVQSASNFYFIHANVVDTYRRWYKNAAKVLFVSQENQHKLETNIACPLENAEIVANPFNIDADNLPGWPEENGVLRLACVGRFHFQSKGQDILIDVINQDKWKDRAIEIHFYGNDQGNLRQFKDLVEAHGLQSKLKHAGFVNNVNEIWEKNHALILPSRYEGAPLVVIEAMLCGRIPITTDIGRNRELCDDGESGFIAASATPELIDQVLERAWEKRSQWKQMGELAAKHIRDRYTSDPVGDMAETIKSIANKN